MSTPKKQWFSAEQEVLLRRMMLDTWNYIGNDVMQAAEEDGKHYLKKADVIEIVLDADHMNIQARTPEQKAALALFDQMPYKDRIKFAKTVFTSERYS